jgi:predicted deacylase
MPQVRTLKPDAGLKVGFEEIAIDLPQARFWIVSVWTTLVDSRIWLQRHSQDRTQNRHDVGTNIPVAVIRGPKPGPTLALVAGAHGTEYASIIALEKLIQELNAPPVQNPVWIERIASVTSETSGVFYPTVKPAGEGLAEE